MKKTGQRTMFGSINENVVEDLIQRTALNKYDTFQDIGSGIGQVCFQASATTCCQSIGLEVDEERYQASVNLLDHFDGVLKQVR